MVQSFPWEIFSIDIGLALALLRRKCNLTYRYSSWATAEPQPQFANARLNVVAGSADLSCAGADSMQHLTAGFWMLE